MFQQVFALLLVFLSHHGEVGGSLQGPTDFPDPFLPGPFHVDHQHIARFDNIKHVIIVILDSIGELIIVIIIIIISDHHLIIMAPNLNPAERSLASLTTTWTFTFPTPTAPFRFGKSCEIKSICQNQGGGVLPRDGLHNACVCLLQPSDTPGWLLGHYHTYW